MPLVFVAAVALLCVLLAFPIVRRRRPRRKMFDAGTISDSWLQQQRGAADDRDR